ncbi:hypothetical protein BDV93DRAFT_562993 [Ceratobasidium sp. AG-I]|nr:hypothetical protein BDV93DRAFT_562993 [Ceratobasidium sp. AG-I]
MNSTCLVEASVDMCNSVTSNPDISGVGVRTAVYVQAFFTIFVPWIMPQDRQAVRHTARNALFDGLISTMLTTLLTGFITQNYQYICALGLSSTIAGMLFLTFWSYWGIQVWVHPSSFGITSLQHQSNLSITNCTANLQTKFVIFGHSVDAATNRPIRIWALIVFSLGVVLAFFALLNVLWGAYYYVAGYSVRIKTAEVESARQLARSAVFDDPTLMNDDVGVSFTSGIASLVYMIITTEQIVQRNPSVSNRLSRWTFGQTLVVILLAQQVLDIIEWVISSERREMIERKKMVAERNRIEGRNLREREGRPVGTQRVWAGASAHYRYQRVMTTGSSGSGTITVKESGAFLGVRRG